MKKITFLKGIFQVFGLAPFCSLETIKNRQNLPRKSILSSVEFKYNFSLVCCLLTMLYKSLMKMLDEPYDTAEELSLLRATDFIETTLSSAASISILMIYCFKKNEFSKIICELSSICENLYTVFGLKSRDTIVKFVTVLVLFNYVIVAFSLYYAMFYIEIAYYVGFYVPCAIIIHSILQYSFVTRLLLSLTLNINNCFQNVVITFSLKKHLGPDTKVFINSNKKMTKRQIIILLRDFYLDLHTLFKIVSEFYSIPIFISIFYSFIISVCTVYVMSSVVFILNASNSFSNSITVFHCFLWISNIIVSIVILCRNITRVLREVYISFYNKDIHSFLDTTTLINFCV